MPDIRSPLAAHYPVGRHGAVASAGDPAVWLYEIVGWDLVQAACWRGCTAALETAIAEATGVTPPAPGHFRAADGVEVTAAAPDRYWCLAPAGDRRIADLAAAIDDDTGCLTQLGHSHIRVRIEGAGARRLLAREIALDLDPGAFPASRAARTMFHQVPVMLQCRQAQPGTFDLYLPHTYAAGTWAYLLDLALTLGYEVSPAREHGAVTAP